jgi:hypothetical protein
MGIMFFVILFLGGGTVEAIIEKAMEIKIKREYEKRRWIRKHRCIA